jgi:hypothetical protein
MSTVCRRHFIWQSVRNLLRRPCHCRAWSNRTFSLSLILWITLPQLAERSGKNLFLLKIWAPWLCAYSLHTRLRIQGPAKELHELYVNFGTPIGLICYSGCLCSLAYLVLQTMPNPRKSRLSGANERPLFHTETLWRAVPSTSLATRDYRSICAFKLSSLCQLEYRVSQSHFLYDTRQAPGMFPTVFSCNLRLTWLRLSRRLPYRVAFISSRQLEHELLTIV